MTITRTHQKNEISSVAIYSDCEKYRYSLTRTWRPDEKRAFFIMLNPSTATEIQNDPTVERCERRARSLGFGSFRVANIFAWRDTDPRNMRAASEPVGPLNDETILAGRDWADQVVCAWGTHGAYLNRGENVALLLGNTPLFHLGLSKAGHPKHPLYISYSVQPVLWARA